MLFASLVVKQKGNIQGRSDYLLRPNPVSCVMAGFQCPIADQTLVQHSSVIDQQLVNMFGQKGAAGHRQGAKAAQAGCHVGCGFQYDRGANQLTFLCCSGQIPVMGPKEFGPKSCYAQSGNLCACDPAG